MKRYVAVCLAAIFFTGCCVGCSKGSVNSGSTSSESRATSQSGVSTTNSTIVSGNESVVSTTSDKTVVSSSKQGVLGSTSVSGSSNSTSSVGTVKPQGEDKMTTAIKAFLNARPNVRQLNDYNPHSNPGSGQNNWSNIQAITYDGATINGKKTKVFAYIGFPEGASASNKVPAVILVHGGGGHAFAEWVKIWTDKGYAAIAMDTTGFYPSASGKGVAGHESDAASLWQYGLHGFFTEAGYVNAPNNDEMQNSAKSYEQQWMYHSVVSTIIANNVLRADSRIDASKIGITGISWGGVITSLAVGFDTRYAFAIPIYGSGYLDVAHSYMGKYFSEANTKKIWSAADRFDQVKCPVLWMGWTNDMPFSINSNALSYAATKNTGSVLSMKIFWGHDHGKGWAPREIYRFADAVTKNGPAMTTCVTEPSGRNISFVIKKPSDAVSVTAQAYYITAPLSYSAKTPGAQPTIDQTWKSVACKVSGDTVTGTLPANANSYYVELTTKTSKGNYITSTRFVEPVD